MVFSNLYVIGTDEGSNWSRNDRMLS